nr:uncharacterized protein LOC128699177 [Cherax quadricarinatus]
MTPLMSAHLVVYHLPSGFAQEREGKQEDETDENPDKLRSRIPTFNIKENCTVISCYASGLSAAPIDTGKCEAFNKLCQHLNEKDERQYCLSSLLASHDYWASKNGPPILDESQDWKLMAGRQNDTHTMIRVRRPITPSTKDDIDVFDFPMWILWAWHPHDPGEDLHPEYHQNNRGARRLCILRSDCWPPSPPPPTRGAAASLTATVAVAAASCLLVLLPQLHLLL